ncbi:MAG: carboxypeptidase regulatory-like protein [Frankiales bacterium]|nr:carboxypeptidase regulatory-like protein [Frankiales bacterium]
MRVEVTPTSSVVEPGRPLPIAITVTNTGQLIGGYAIRVLGADPGWVELASDRLSLFPATTETVMVIVTVPEGIPAGDRRVAIQVRELTVPHETAISEIELQVPSAPALHLRLDPVTAYRGRRASFGAIVENKGNTTVRGRFAGLDAEAKIRFEFAPEVLNLAPGEHRVVEIQTKARRPLTGSPMVRPFGVHLTEAPTTPTADDQPLATGTFLQKPWLSRGPISLLGLLAAVTVFAIVITVALARLVGQSAADRDLALQVAQARNLSATTGTSSLSGSVRLLTSGTAVPGVAVEAFLSSDVANPIATTATDAKGAFSLSNLAEGSYKLRFRGAGFVQVWYPAAATDADATTITLQAGQNSQGLDVRLGGVPATIAGTVTGDDVSGSTVYLELPGSGAAAGSTATTGTRTTVSTPPVANAPPGTTEAIVQSVPVGSDGTFTINNVASPSVYDLVVAKTGYANDTERVDVAGGETRRGVQLQLRQGDGLISGQINGPDGALGGATITATSAQSTVRTVSLTQDQVGSFTLLRLPTPATFTIVVSKTGFASQTVTLALTSGQKLTGVAVTLGQSAGSLSGQVSVLPGGHPAAGVSVTITDGALTVQTVTRSTGDVGAWTVSGLTIPSTYTVTFSRADLATQTVSVSLDAFGTITPGSQGARITSDGISVSMQSATAVVRGTVTQHLTATGAATERKGEVQINLVSGMSTFAVTSASVPTARGGQYEIDGVPPGTYTLSVNRRGTSPTSTIVTLAAGDVHVFNPVLAAAARISGVIRTANGQARPGWEVRLYLATQYPTVVYKTVTTDSSGAFSFDDVDAPQSYVVEARPTDQSAPQGSSTVQIEPSQQLPVNVTVPNPAGG